MIRENMLLGVKITDGKMDEILEYVIGCLEKKNEKFYIVTPNPEILVYARAHTTFKNVLNQARIALADGIGITLSGILLGHPFQERVTGVDFVENFCKKIARKTITVGFLGGKGRVAEKAAERLNEKNIGLKIAFAMAGNPDEATAQAIKERVQKPIDMLFVAYGFPKQEEWIARYLPELPVKAAMSVGGTFDYISGTLPRAPKLLRTLGFEWLYRLVRQPWRVKRQRALLTFVELIMREKLRQIFRTRSDKQ